MRPVIIDTDPGIDDIAALLLALSSPELEVLALTTIYGNSSVDSCTANALQLLVAAGRADIPVFPGAGKPLLRPAKEGWASHIHGADGLGGITGIGEGTVDPLSVNEKHAALAIVEMVMAMPGEVTILALGRMTNVALALSLEPEMANSVREVVVMGGAVTVPGNVSQVATANLHEDPEAAAILYRSGAPIVQVGLDVCNRVTVSPAQLATIARGSNPGTQLLARATEFLRDAYIRSGRIGPDEGVRYNDMPAVGYAVKPELFAARSALVEIETRSELTLGQTVADWQAEEPNARICLDVDSEALTALFTERLTKLDG
jgi:inosine-uridine nucleoside N-ribohydrolase